MINVTLPAFKLVLQRDPFIFEFRFLSFLFKYVRWAGFSVLRLSTPRVEKKLASLFGEALGKWGAEGRKKRAEMLDRAIWGDIHIDSVEEVMDSVRQNHLRVINQGKRKRLNNP